MTIQEIKELVSKKIAGQGSQVDIGGALAEVLTGICDAIIASEEKSLRISPSSGSLKEATKAQMAEFLNISEENVEALINGEIKTLIVSSASGELLLRQTEYANMSQKKVYFGYKPSNDGTLVTIGLTNLLYDYSLSEV